MINFKFNQRKNKKEDNAAAEVTSQTPQTVVNTTANEDAKPLENATSSAAPVFKDGLVMYQAPQLPTNISLPTNTSQPANTPQPKPDTKAERYAELYDKITRNPDSVIGTLLEKTAPKERTEDIATAEARAKRAALYNAANALGKTISQWNGIPVSPTDNRYIFSKMAEADRLRNDFLERDEQFNGFLLDTAMRNSAGRERAEAEAERMAEQRQYDMAMERIKADLKERADKAGRDHEAGMLKQRQEFDATEGEKQRKNSLQISYSSNAKGRGANLDKPKIPIITYIIDGKGQTIPIGEDLANSLYGLANRADAPQSIRLLWDTIADKETTVENRDLALKELLRQSYFWNKELAAQYGTPAHQFEPNKGPNLRPRFDATAPTPAAAPQNNDYAYQALDDIFNEINQ